MSAGWGSPAPRKSGMDLTVAAARPGAGPFDRRVNDGWKGGRCSLSARHVTGAGYGLGRLVAGAPATAGHGDRPDRRRNLMHLMFVTLFLETDARRAAGRGTGQAMPQGPDVPSPSLRGWRS